MGNKISDAPNEQKRKITTVGDRVKLKKGDLVGTVRFIGPIQEKPSIYYGIELDEKKGKNNGSVKGHFYFPKVEDKKGLFIIKSSILKTNIKGNQEAARVSIGDIVNVAKYKTRGVIKWIGVPEFSDKGIFYGIELEMPYGKTNGTVQDKWYFECKDKHATFVQSTSFTLIDTQNVSETLEQKPKIKKKNDKNDNNHKNKKYKNDKNDQNEKKKNDKNDKNDKDKTNSKNDKKKGSKRDVEFDEWFQAKCEEKLRLMQQEREELERSQSELRKKDRIKCFMIFVSSLVVAVAIAFGVWKAYYINEEYESEMRCYNFMTMTESKYSFLGLLYYYYNNMLSVRIEDDHEISEDNQLIHYEHPYNNIEFEADVSQFTGLELDYNVDAFDALLKEYRCNDKTRMEVLTLSYDAFSKSSFHVDRSKETAIEAFYLRIFVEKVAENKYNAKCGIVYAVYNFPHGVTDGTLQIMIENEAIPRFKKDLNKPRLSDYY